MKDIADKMTVKTPDLRMAQECPPIKPTKNWLLVRFDPTPSESLIVIPNMATVQKPYMKGCVEAAGPGLMDAAGNPAGCCCTGGDTIIVMPNPKQMIPVDGGEILKSMDLDCTRWFLLPDDIVPGVYALN